MSKSCIIDVAVSDIFHWVSCSVPCPRYCVKIFHIPPNLSRRSFYDFVMAWKEIRNIFHNYQIMVTSSTGHTWKNSGRWIKQQGSKLWFSSALHYLFFSKNITANLICVAQQWYISYTLVLVGSHTHDTVVQYCFEFQHSIALLLAARIKPSR